MDILRNNASEFEVPLCIYGYSQSSLLASQRLYPCEYEEVGRKRSIRE